MYMILVGGGNVGIQLAKRLTARGDEVLLIEKDPTVASKLANLLGDECVMHGDGCELYTQRDAGFNRADVVVAVTGEDEDNFVVCQLAKEVWHTERVLARVNDPSHEDIFRDIGIDETVSATGIIYNLLVQQIAADDLIPVAERTRAGKGTRRSPSSRYTSVSAATAARNSARWASLRELKSRMRASPSKRRSTVSISQNTVTSFTFGSVNPASARAR